MPRESAAEHTTRSLADRMVASGELPRRDWHDVAAVGLTVAIALAWLAMALLGVAAFVWARPIWWLFGGALVAGAVMLRPRPLRLGRVVELDAARAEVRSPAVDGALAGLAAEVGARPPDVVFVTTVADIALVRDSLGRRQVLLVGMPLWVLLSDAGRRAAVVHELGHDSFRDPRRVGLPSLARRWLEQWSVQLGAGVEGNAIDRPADELVLLDPLVGDRIVNVGLHGPTVTRFASNLFDAFLGRLVGATSRLLERLTFVPHQRAELLADAAAVRVAGTAAVGELLDAVPLRRRAMLSARQSLLRTDGVDLAHTVLDHLAALPDHQREGLAVTVANEEVRTDQAHPPVRVRRELVARLAPRPGLPVPDAAAWRAAGDDLVGAFAPLEQQLRELARREGQSRRSRR